MTISGNVPQHLVVSARSGFLAAIKGADFPWMRVAEKIVATAKSTELVDLGGAPMPLEDKDGGPAQGFVERALEVKPRNWVIKVGLAYNAAQDDQTGGSLLRKVQGAGDNFQRHVNKLVFQALNGGDGSTYGLCYDGGEFFDSSHPNAPGTAIDNLFALTLTLDNFQTNYNLARLFFDEQDEYTDYNYDLLVVPPAYERIASQICNNGEDYATGNRAINPYSGRMSYIVSPYLDSTAWIGVASNESAKPLALVMREEPFMQDAWFDPDGPDGGTYFFKFFARYNVAYGDYRLAFMGAT